MILTNRVHAFCDDSLLHAADILFDLVTQLQVTDHSADQY